MPVDRQHPLGRRETHLHQGPEKELCELQSTAFHKEVEELDYDPTIGNHLGRQVKFLSPLLAFGPSPLR
jgi:hypothetical protein